MSERTKALREERLKIHGRIQEILQRAEKDGFSQELRDNLKAAEDDFLLKTDELDAVQREDERSASLNAPQEVRVGGADPPKPDAEKRDKQYAEAFNLYIRKGVQTPELRGQFRDLLAEGGQMVENRDLSDITGTAGGFTVPQGFLAKITQRQRYFGPMRQLANKINTTSGQDLPWVKNDDTGVVASVLGENVQISNADPAFGAATLKAYIWTSGLVRVPWTLLNDSAFDVEGFLSGIFAKRFGRGQNTAFTVGAGHGSNTAQGIVPGLQAAGAANLFVTTAGATAITFADIMALRFKIDQAYRPTAVWQFSDDAMRSIMSLVDGNGRPLFTPAGQYGSIAVEAPDTLLGRPLYINNDLAPVLATNVTGLFGDFEAAYVIRDVQDMQVMALRERYADYLQTGFFAFMRTDAVVDDSYAAAYLVQA